MGESQWLREMRTLDPKRDCRRIVFLDSFCEFPFDTSRALELAFFKTFASPSIAALLDSTGEFRLRGQKRYDDTSLLLEQPLLDGFEHPSSRQAIRRINQMHHPYEIGNDDLRYVLATFVVVPNRRRWSKSFTLMTRPSVS